VDIPRKYPEVIGRHRSRFWADEFVETRDGALAIDGDPEPTRPCPRDPELIQRCAEQPADVFGSIREVVANASHAAIVRHNAAAIAIYQAANESLGGFFDEIFLPRFQSNRP
jgi:hypothetical protein